MQIKKSVLMHFFALFCTKFARVLGRIRKNRAIFVQVNGGGGVVRRENLKICKIMATVRICLDKRTTRKDGSSPLKLRITHKGGAVLIGLNLFIAPENWDDTIGKAYGAPGCKNMNMLLTQKRLEAENILFRLEANGLIDGMDIGQLRDAVTGKKPPAEGRKSFAAAFRRFINQKNKARTKEVYECTLKKLQAFCPDLENLRFEEITKGWLTDFDAFLARTSPSRNARNVHLRNIRAVFNFAIDEGYTAFYPFRRFKIRPEQTRKRCLSVDQLRALRDFPCEEHQAKYRDMFMLMFYLIGINPVDLSMARKTDVDNGRLEYRRSKTGKLYSVLIEPEAWEIINRYSGKGDRLVDITDHCENYRDFFHRMNKELKRIGAVERKGRGGKKLFQPSFPDLSAYWARHTWATIAYSIDVPKETISEGLGHEIGCPTTSIYIAFDRRKVDEANRRVIDYVAEK